VPPRLLDITLAHGSPSEQATRTQLERLVSSYDITPWLLTRQIVVDESTIPHSHPVLTLHAKHLKDDDLLLSTLLHEELHWFALSRHEHLEHAVDELRERLPGLPVGYPDGADSDQSSYEHLAIIYLEYEGLLHFVGEARAKAAFHYWEDDHYRTLYRTVREHRRAVAQIVASNELIPTFLQVTREANAPLFDDAPAAGDDPARAPPDAVDADALDHLIVEADASRSDSLVVLRDGKLVCERYFGHPRSPIETMSVTKSFVSLAIGFLIAEGKVPSLDVPLSRYYPEFRAGLKAKVTLRHVLTHTSGLEHRPAAGVLSNQADRLAYVRSLSVVDDPGTKFSYNNEAVQLLSGVIATAAKKPVDAYLNEKLFEPLGSREWSWAKDKKGNVATFYGLSLSARDMAKIGVTLLADGRYQGREIVPTDWVRTSTRPARADLSWTGLLWWIENDGPWFMQTAASLGSYAPASFTAAPKLAPLTGRRFPSRSAYWAEAGALLSSTERAAFTSWVRDEHVPFATEEAHTIGFRADGWLGQYIVVYPELGLVGVRQHREPEGGGDERENETYGFKEFPMLVNQLALRTGVDGDASK